MNPALRNRRLVAALQGQHLAGLVGGGDGAAEALHDLADEGHLLGVAFGQFALAM